jgi:ABC-type glycerol-3-phosphate transport system substrate-binding protein
MKIRLALPAAVCALVLLSCGPGSATAGGKPEGTAPGTAAAAASGIPTIRFAYCWAHGFNETMAARREAVKDSYDLVAEQSNGIQHRTKILLDVSSNNLPDVFTFWSYDTNLRFFVDNDLIVDAQELFDASEKLRREDFLDAALAATELDGRNWAIPYERFFGIFIANKKLLDGYGLPLPRTMADVAAMASVLRPRGIVPLTMGSYLGDPGHLLFTALAYQTPGAKADTEAMKRTGDFIYPGTAAAAEAALSLVASGAIPENTIEAGSWDYQVNQYNQRKAAMIYTFNWTLALFDPAVAAESVIIPMPRIGPGAADTSAFTVGGISQSLCVSKASWNDPDKRGAIIDFLEWIFSDEVFVARTGQEGSLPTRRVELPEFGNPIYGKAYAYAASVETYGLHEFYFNSPAAFDTYKEANDLLWSGSISAREFLDLVQGGMKEGTDRAR